MKLNKTLLSVAILSGIATYSSSSLAAGFQLAEYSATGLGRAYAGEAAMADNAGSQWRNPALLTYLEGTQVSGGVIYVNPNIDVSGNVSYGNNDYDVNTKDYADDAVIPNFYLSHKLNDKIGLGLALGTNYGMTSDLTGDYAASHYGDSAEVITQELNLNIGYQLTEAVSIGGGIRYVMAEGHFGASAPTHSAASQYLGVDTLKYMEGDTTEWGWQIGTVWQVNDHHRVGFAYKSEVDLKLEGTATGYGFFGDTTTSASGYLPLTLPATAEIASMYQLSEQTTITASINWTDWSSFDKLEATVDGIGTSNVKDEGWEDSYRFAVGAEYQIDSKWLVRTGVAYDTSAVSDQNRSATIPETDRTWLSLGTGYTWSPQLTFDAAFTYIIAKDATISEPRGYADDDTAAAVGGTFEGKTTGNVWLVGVQANYRF
ncbi:outer membrane protein transport protein [Vibrio algarum]|uniref:Outer membrane protein transport protein n=1 Tax=Vibrio algarum TaxID=3020714 RepID=A0ABT4YPA7_9VIBR|nr:outer membrane protein transport protein [Vibrio sp. KJ40-1]MDB1123333.1 outer membrane protein transport protein [Vibrio sp. KJ40-1]